MSNDTSGSGVSRRSILKIGSAALIGAWSRGEVPAIAGQSPAAETNKPLHLAPETADIAGYSRAENLFWCDIMMEHASFFSTLMPGADLSAQRGQAESFQRTFQAQYDRAKSATIDKTNYAAFNSATIEMLKPFIEYKRRMLETQNSGRMRSFVFPLFFDHSANEAEHAVRRLERLSMGDQTVDFTDVIDFGSTAMSDESALIAHFLDPQEQDLMSQALDSSAVFKGINHGNKQRALPKGEILLALEEFTDFEMTIEDGVSAGRIKSIITPAFADHIRRETLKFMDDLKRSGRKT
jgi:hypothetical protein